MRLDSGNRLAFAEPEGGLNAPIVLTFAFVRIGSATKCAQCGDDWGELADVWVVVWSVIDSVVV